MLASSFNAASEEDALGAQNGVPLMQTASALSALYDGCRESCVSTDSVAGGASTGHILNLPNEILQRILVHASVELPSDKVVSSSRSDWKAQGFFEAGATRRKDALNMCLVCKRFYHCMACTQFTSLDTFVVPSPSQFPYGCHTFDDLQNFSAIQYLNLSNANVLPNLRGLENCPDLKFLNLRHCSTLQTFAGLEKCLQLYDLNLHGCRQLFSLQGLPRSEKLKHLNLYGCDYLHTLEGVDGCPALENIHLPDNTSLDLQRLQSCPMLKHVAFFGMPSNRLLVLAQCNQLEQLLCRDKKDFRDISDQLKQVLGELKERKVLAYHRRDLRNKRLQILNQHYAKDWRPQDTDQAWDTFFLDYPSFLERVVRSYDNA